MASSATTKPGTKAAGRPAKRPMPKAERRVQLLEIAYQIIDREGVGALNMQALAERSGASKPVVYEHFRNSQDVIFCMLDSYFQRMSKFVLEANANARDLRDFFDVSIDAMFAFHEQERFNLKRITNGFSIYERTNDLFFDYNMRSVEFYKLLLIQQGVEQQQAGILATILHEMILGSVNDYATRRDREAAKLVLKQSVGGILTAFAGKPGQRPQPPAGVLKLDP